MSTPCEASATEERRGPHVVVVGAGFAGYEAARRLARTARGRARITIVDPTDYFFYLPLLPEVATGILEPRRVTVSLSGTRSSSSAAGRWSGTCARCSSSWGSAHAASSGRCRRHLVGR